MNSPSLVNVLSEYPPVESTITESYWIVEDQLVLLKPHLSFLYGYALETVVVAVGTYLVLLSREDLLFVLIDN